VSHLRLADMRAQLPPVLADLSTWPAVDPGALSPTNQRRFADRARAMVLAIERPDVSPAEIQRLTGVWRHELVRLLGRCLEMAPDGRIYGYRGLLPWKHVRVQQRRQVVLPSEPSGRGGAAGAFVQLLRAHPNIQRWLDRELNQRLKPLAAGEIRIVNRKLNAIHTAFLQKLREAGLTDKDYPFNRDLMGRRTLSTYAKHHALTSQFAAQAEGMPGGSSAGHAKNLKLVSALPTPALPFDAVQFDGHKIDARFSVRIDSLGGMETVYEVSRIWLLLCLDVVTRAALGYALVIAPEYNSDEVARCIQSCFGKSEQPAFTIPGLKLKDGAGFPKDLFEPASYASWGWFMYDSARANLAAATLERLINAVGCYVSTGRLGEPNDRSVIERFFKTFEAHGFHSIPGTTGASPTDVARKLGDVGSDIQRLMSVDQLNEIVYAMLANYNAEPHGSLGGRTPNEAMRYWIDKYGLCIRRLPADQRRRLAFLQEARLVTVVGGKGTKAAPHINFEGVRYSSAALQSKPDLIGKKLRLTFNVMDVRSVEAFFADDGSELGVLTASRAWARTPHSLRLRKEILRYIRLKKIRLCDGDDAIECWAAYARKAAIKDRRKASAIGKQFQYQTEVTTPATASVASEREPEAVRPDGTRAPTTHPDEPIEPLPLKLQVGALVLKDRK
jgi:putative transposase